jgi:hypothetical protein
MSAAATVMLVALVAEDPVSLRNRPDPDAPAQAELHRGDWLEIRGEVAGYLKVWDHRHERPGYVRPREVRTYSADDGAADALAAVVGFLRDRPGQESLGIGHAALYLKAAAAERLQGAQGAAIFEALGAMADRLGRRLSASGVSGSGVARSLAAELAVAESYGVRYVSRDDGARTIFCYDGEAFSRTLAIPRAAARDRTNALLALTAPGCRATAQAASPSPSARRAWNEQRLRLLDAADAADAVPAHLALRLRLLRAEALAIRAHDELRRERPDLAADSQAAAARALAGVERDLLAPEDRPTFEAVTTRVAAGRFTGEALPPRPPGLRDAPTLALVPRAPGEICVQLVSSLASTGDPRPGTAAVAPHFERCTYGLPRAASARWSSSGDTLALAVTTAEAWTELWLLHRGAAGWTLTTIPPATGAAGVPIDLGRDVGTSELAGFVPDGGVLVARQAVVRGQVQRRFELRAVGSALVQKSASRHELLLSFRRFAAPWWKATSYATR